MRAGEEPGSLDQSLPTDSYPPKNVTWQPMESTPPMATYEEPNITRLTSDFLSNTTVHGLPKLVQSQGVSRKVVWAAVFVLAFAYFFYQIQQNVNTYLQYPVTVSSVIDYRPTRPFPAVTVCNMNSMERIKLRHSPTYKKLYLLDHSFATGFTNGEEEEEEEEEEGNANPTQTTTSQPVTASQQTTTTTSQPVTASQQTTTTTSQPVTASQQTATTTSQPVTASQQTTTTTSQPVTASQQTTTTTSQPVTASQQTATTTSQPVTASQQTATTTSQPVTASQQTATTTSQPVTASQQTTTASQQPTAPPQATTAAPPPIGRKKRQVDEHAAEGDVQLQWRRESSYKISDPELNGHVWNAAGGVKHVRRPEQGVLLVDVPENKEGDMHRRSQSPKRTKRQTGGAPAPPAPDRDEDDFEYEEAFGGVQRENDFVGFLNNSKADDLSDLGDVLKPSVSDLDMYGVVISQFILQCSFDKQNCSHLNFTTIYNAYFGKCFTFNTANATTGYVKTTSKYGASNGLRLTLNINREQYVGLFTHKVGARVVVHANDVTPFPEDNGINAPPGFQTDISVRSHETFRQKSPYNSNCTDGEEHNDCVGGNYTKQGCMRQCLQFNMFEYCGCYDDCFTKSNATRCSITNTTQEKCRQRVRHQFAKAILPCDKMCALPCSEQSFSLTVSLAEWPAAQFWRLWVNYQRTRPSFNPSNYVGKFWEEIEDVEEIGKNLVRVHVYIEDQFVSQIKESAEYTWEKLMADLGGLLGLFVGISALSVMELFELIVDVCFLVPFHRYINRNRVSLASPNREETKDSSTRLK